MEMKENTSSMPIYTQSTNMAYNICTRTEYTHTHTTNSKLDYKHGYMAYIHKNKTHIYTHPTIQS